MNTDPELKSNDTVNDKAVFVRRGFDEIARRYDLLNDVMTFGLHRGWKRDAVAKLQCGEDARILDLCSGTGDLAMRAAVQLPGSSVIALDFSMNMMANGRARTALSECSERIHWLGGDATRLPFADECFDGALVGFGLRNVASLDAALREAARVLKPGARLVNLDTAGAEFAVFEPFYRLHMNLVVPLLGRILAGSGDMYSYLSSSAAAFETPPVLANAFSCAGFRQTGYLYRPRGLGGAALVWGEKA